MCGFVIYVNSHLFASIMKYKMFPVILWLLTNKYNHFISIVKWRCYYNIFETTSSMCLKHTRTSVKVLTLAWGERGKKVRVGGDGGTCPACWQHGSVRTVRSTSANLSNYRKQNPRRLPHSFGELRQAGGDP